MTCRDEILMAVERLTERAGEGDFTLQELVEEMRQYSTTYKESTICTHVTSRLCTIAPDRHAVTYRDLERVASGRCRLVGQAHATPESGSPDVAPPTAAAPHQLLGRAARIAAVAHEHQVDKVGEAYILHPLRLMSRAQTDDERIVAFLHDVVEDSDWTLEALVAEGFPPHIVDAIGCLTSCKGESYDDFISRVLASPLAARIKLLDIEDNMDMTRLGELTDKDLERLRKYHAARQRLLGV